MRPNIEKLIHDSDIDVQAEPASAEDQSRIAAAFARIPAIQAAADKARGPRYLTPEQAIRAAEVAAIHEAARAAKHREEVLAASAASIVAANAAEAAEALRLDEDKGTNVDKTLQHAKLDADKAAKKDESDDPLQRILAALSDFAARLDSLEQSHKRSDAAKRKDEEAMPSPFSKQSDGEDKGEAPGGMSEHEREKAKPLVADAIADEDAISDWRAMKLERVLGAHGLDSIRPLMGETLKGYQLRTLTRLKRFSPKFKDVDLASLKGAAFAAVTGIVLDEAFAAGERGPEVAEGAGLVEVKRRDPSGRTISTFHGDGKTTFIRDMSARPRYVKSFLTVQGHNTGGGA
jgi:hypothetical protein